MMFYASLAVTAIVGFAVSYALGFIVIPWLHKLKYGQTILDIGPKWHKKKEGTPTMGGILFIVGTLLAFAVGFFMYMTISFKHDNSLKLAQVNVKVWGGILMALGFTVIGLVDDYIMVVKKRNLGLTIKQKTFLQLLVSIGYLGSLYAVQADYMFIPFLGNFDMGILFWVFGIFVIYCTINAVNFTDGIDGLCGSVTVTAAAAFIVAAALREYFEISVLAAALLGGCAGYLMWNKYPAKVMMGDTGSMFLGGMIVALAYAVDCPLLILPFGIIYVIEFASDIIQIVYYKATRGKRVFKMAPIHHHFEMSGWKETKIVKVFTVINIIGCVIGLLLVYYGRAG
jgi:phospho-N-acetylmuramoyl-pentapeptide-transferase